MKKRLLTAVFAVCFILQLVSCSEGAKPLPPSTYVNEDYHFSFTRPGEFSSVELVESEENSDECDIFFKDPDTDRMIVLSCKFNPEDDFYSYMTSSRFDKNKITCVNQNTFIYDDRSSSSPSYSLISATKRMIFTAKYEMEGSASREDIAICDAMAFEFDVYANTPKLDPMLSGTVYLYEDMFSLKIPANAEYKLLPEQEAVTPDTSTDTSDGEEDTHVPSPYTSVTVKNRHYTAKYSLSSPNDAALSPEKITEETAKAVTADEITEFSDTLISGVTLKKAELLSSEEGDYIYVPFACVYGNGASYGAYIMGYSHTGVFYKYVYACQNSAPEGESDRFKGMLESAVFE